MKIIASTEKRTDQFQDRVRFFSVISTFELGQPYQDWIHFIPIDTDFMLDFFQVLKNMS